MPLTAPLQRDALLPYRYLYELARLLANVTDGAEDADQGIIGPCVAHSPVF